MNSTAATLCLKLTPRNHNNETRADTKNTDPCNRREEKPIGFKLSPFYAAVLSVGKFGFDRPRLSGDRHVICLHLDSRRPRGWHVAMNVASCKLADAVSGNSTSYQR